MNILQHTSFIIAKGGALDRTWLPSHMDICSTNKIISSLPPSKDFKTYLNDYESHSALRKSQRNSYQEVIVCEKNLITFMRIRMGCNTTK